MIKEPYVRYTLDNMSRQKLEFNNMCDAIIKDNLGNTLYEIPKMIYNGSTYWNILDGNSGYSLINVPSIQFGYNGQNGYYSRIRINRALGGREFSFKVAHNTMGEYYKISWGVVRNSINKFLIVENIIVPQTFDKDNYTYQVTIPNDLIVAGTGSVDLTTELVDIFVAVAPYVDTNRISDTPFLYFSFDNVISITNIDYYGEYIKDRNSFIHNNEYAIKLTGEFYSYDYSSLELSHYQTYYEYFYSNNLRDIFVEQNNIMLYNNSSENNRVNKYEYLSNPVLLQGKFREEISKTDLVIRIEFHNKLLDYNYCYISSLERFYYIDDIVCVRDKIYDIHCRIDVLMSYKENIQNLYCKVARQEFNYNDNLIDNELPTKVENDYVYIYSDSNEDFDSPVFFDMSTKCIAIATTAYKVDLNQTHPSMSNGSTNIYAVNATQLNEISKQIISDNVLSQGIGALFQNAGDGIMNITVYPFDLDDAIGLDGIETDKFQVGLRTLNVSDITLLSNTISISKFICDISIPRKYNNFLDYSPYCDCEMWLPMIGYVKLDVNKLIGKTISIILDINPINGRGVYRILDNNSNILYVFDCNVGINIPINKSSLNDSVNSLIMTGIRATSRIISLGNTQDKIDVKQTKVNRGRSGNVSSVVSKSTTVKGEKYFDTDKLPNIMGDTTCNIINSLKTHIESGSISNGWESVLLPYEVHIVLRYLIPIEVDGYAHLVGKPSSYYGKLKNLTGYTEVGACHMDGFPNCTQSELDEIETLLKTGVILP